MSRFLIRFRIFHRRSEILKRSLFLGLLVLLSACRQETENVKSDGESLAQVHCASCHLFPEPALLDRATWIESTLPFMGQRLGIYAEGKRDSLIEPLVKEGIDPTLYFPESPVLPAEDWAAIVGYYEAHAPEALEEAKAKLAVAEMPGFSMRLPDVSFSPPLTTLVQMQESFSAYFVGNYATNNTLVLLNDAGQIMYHFELTGTPVATRVDGQRLYILMIGQGPEPRVTTRGAIYVVADPEVGPELVLDGLNRPVDFELANLNDDGLNDFVICEYGHYSGTLSWYEQNTKGGFVKHVLKNEPGAIAVELHDFDKDGLLDLGVLMSQGDEGIDIHFNKGNGVFEEQRVLRFPPVYGSSSFSLVDFNQDGLVDILYTNGDNADSSPILKNYHGIRIFQAREADTYEEVLFYPLNGAFSAQAADFDQNGHLDIAAISYFPDYATQPVESFVLLMDQGQMNYTPHSFDGAARGRWFVMDVGDIDGDTDMDIILGSNIGFGPQGDQTGLFKQWEQEAISYVILENERL